MKLYNFDEFINEKSNYGFVPIDKQILQNLESELNSEFLKCKVGEQEQLWKDGINGKGPFGKICKKYNMEIGDPTSKNLDDGKFRWLMHKKDKVAFIEFDDDYETGDIGGSGYRINISNNY